MDAFLQTLMHEPDIETTAISTPWGLYEWVVKLQGACNSPATQQRCLNEALRNFIPSKRSSAAHIVGLPGYLFPWDLFLDSENAEEAIKIF